MTWTIIIQVIFYQSIHSMIHCSQFHLSIWRQSLCLVKFSISTNVSFISLSYLPSYRETTSPIWILILAQILLYTLHLQYSSSHIPPLHSICRILKFFVDKSFLFVTDSFGPIQGWNISSMNIRSLKAYVPIMSCLSTLHSTRTNMTKLRLFSMRQRTGVREPPP